MAAASIYNLFLPICLFMSARPCLRTVTPEPCLHKGKGVLHRQAPSAAMVMWFCFVLFYVGAGLLVITVHMDQALRYAKSTTWCTHVAKWANVGRKRLNMGSFQLFVHP